MLKIFDLCLVYSPCDTVPCSASNYSAANAAWSNEIDFRASTITLVKTLKDARQLLRTDANTGITNKKTLCTTRHLRCSTYYYHTTGGCKFDGIMYKIDEHARNLLTIGGNHGLSLRYIGTQHDAMALRLWKHTRHRLSYKLLSLHWFDHHGNLARLDTRQFE